MNKQILERINQETAQLHKRLNEDRYDIPMEKQITIGDDTVIAGIYLNDSDYKGIPFADGYLECADVHFSLALDVLEDKIGWEIVNILTMANVTKRYDFKDIADILVQMQEYVVDAPDEEMKEYFREITDTGFFHNAVGKIAEYNKDNTYVLVSEEY